MNKRTVKTNWRIYERSEVYPQCMSHYLDLLRQKKGRGQFKYLANHYEIIAYSRLKQGQYFWWARDIDQLKKTTSVWIKEWIRKRSSFEEIKKIFYISRQKFKKDFSKVEKQLIKAKSSREFYKLYSAIKQSCFEHILFSEYTVDTFDDFFGDFFAEYLFKASDNKISQVEISDLGQSVYLSESLNYKKEILKLSLKEKTAIKNMKKIVARYEWIMMSWDGKNIITEATILKDIKKVRQQSLDSRKSEIKKIDNFSRDVIKRRKFLLKKYHFSLKEINKYFSLLDYFTKFHDWRKEIQMRANKVIFSVLKKIALHFNINYSDLLFYENNEIEKLCVRGIKVSSVEILKRKEGISLIITNGKVERYTGKQAKAVLEQLLAESAPTDKINSIKGIPASKGIAKGLVFVGKDGYYASRKIKKGQILVASMTTVDYLPAMKKASAIVTDDGGITSHAAIISRELGIPCIVGTKIATKVLKDGDLVEVNANKGEVKILN